MSLPAIQSRDKIMSSKARFCVFVAIGALLFLEPGTAQAQSRWPNTQNVNECTQLNDPDQTRRCIEAYQGAQTDPVAAPRTPSTPFCCRCRVSRQPHAEFRLRQVAETETARSLSESICSCARASFLSDLLRSDRRAIRANQYKLGQPITTRTLAAGICCRGGQFHCQNGLRIKSASNCR